MTFSAAQLSPQHGQPGGSRHCVSPARRGTRRTAKNVYELRPVESRRTKPRATFDRTDIPLSVDVRVGRMTQAHWRRVVIAITGRTAGMATNAIFSTDD